jgi:hypothetical protein
VLFGILAGDSVHGKYSFLPVLGLELCGDLADHHTRECSQLSSFQFGRVHAWIQQL